MKAFTQRLTRIGQAEPVQSDQESAPQKGDDRRKLCTCFKKKKKKSSVRVALLSHYDLMALTLAGKRNCIHSSVVVLAQVESFLVAVRGAQKESFTRFITERIRLYTFAAGLPRMRSQIASRATRVFCVVPMILMCVSAITMRVLVTFSSV